MTRRSDRDPAPLPLAKRVRRFVRTGPLYGWRFAGPAPERIAWSVTNLLPGDAARARAIYLGRFDFAGTAIETGGGAPFAAEAGNQGWQAELHGFAWLRDLAADGGELAASNARALISDWADLCAHQVRNAPWYPVTAATRLMSFLRHQEFILQNSNQAFYRRFCSLIARHVRYLRTVTRGLDDEAGAFQLRLALAIAAFAMPLSVAYRKRALDRVQALTKSQILPDGGHVARNADLAAALLHDLMSLKALLETAGEPVPDALIRVTDRMYPALRAMVHSDGSMSRFNGSGLIPSDHLDALLQHDPTEGGTAALISHSGYWNRHQGGTVVIADMGAAPKPGFDTTAHAGLTSMEMSSDGHRFISNIGPTLDSEFSLTARASAAHCMAVPDGQDAAEFAPRQAGWGQIVFTALRTPKEPTGEVWNTPGWTGWRCGHDGFGANGLAHERGIRLSDDGNRIDGYDRFRPLDESAAAMPDCRIDLRFHLDAGVNVRPGEKPGLVVFWPKDDATIGWTFSAEGQTVEIGDSIQFHADGTRAKTKVITLSFKTSETDTVAWRFHRSKA